MKVFELEKQSNYKMKSILVLILGANLACGSEFSALLNGKDFAGWGGKGKTEHMGYVLKDGIIESTKKCGYLFTEKSYTNYVFKFEFQLTPGANSGLGIHYPGTGHATFDGMEIQILDDTHPKYVELKDYQFHGGLYELKAAKKGHLKPVGEWNEQTITVNGPLVKVELNGTVILEANLDQLEKLKPKHKGVKRREGRLCICGHKDIVRFRKLQLMKLPIVE